MKLKEPNSREILIMNKLELTIRTDASKMLVEASLPFSLSVFPVPSRMEN